MGARKNGRSLGTDTWGERDSSLFPRACAQLFPCYAGYGESLIKSRAQSNALFTWSIMPPQGHSCAKSETLETNSLNSLFSVGFSTFSPCLQEFTRNDSHSSLTLIIVFNYGALSLFSSTTLFMQRICFGIFQRLGVESSSKNIGNKRKMSHLDCFKPWLMLLSLSGKKNTGNTNPSKQKLIWIGHTRMQWGSHGSTGAVFHFRLL